MFDCIFFLKSQSWSTSLDPHFGCQPDLKMILGIFHRLNMKQLFTERTRIAQRHESAASASVSDHPGMRAARLGTSQATRLHPRSFTFPVALLFLSSAERSDSDECDVKHEPGP